MTSLNVSHGHVFPSTFYRSVHEATACVSSNWFGMVQRRTRVRLESATDCVIIGHFWRLISTTRE